MNLDIGNNIRLNWKTSILCSVLCFGSGLEILLDWKRKMMMMMDN
jgi:hypothetical protein